MGAAVAEPYVSPLATSVNGRIFYSPHPGKQEAILRVLGRRLTTGEGPSTVFIRGNRGGGKSLLVRKGFLHGVALAIPGLRYVVIRQNYPDLEMNHLQYLNDEMGQLGGTYHETKHVCYYPNGSRGFYRPCETAADVRKIVGAEAAVLFSDESPEIQWEFLRTIGPSLRVARRSDGTQPYYTLAIYSGNPMGESIEEHDRYCIDKDVDPLEDQYYRPEDFACITLRREDNPSIDEAEYRKQFAGMPLHFQAAWIDGVRMEARTLFDVQKTKDGKPWHVIQELPTVNGRPVPQVEWVQIYRAFDMGYFPDPAMCVWFAVYGNRIVAFHEETWFRTVAADLAAKMTETTRELTGREDVVMTYVDPQINVKSGQDIVTVMDVLEMHGVPCEPSINDRVLYADAIHGLLGTTVDDGQPMFQIYEPGCPTLTKYLPKMRWDEKNPRKMADHKFDHPVVCTAYFAISSGVLSFAEETTTAQEPFWKQWFDEERTKRGRGRRR